MFIIAETLGAVKFIKEKKLICKFFDEISIDSGKYCFGVDETMKALEMGTLPPATRNRTLSLVLRTWPYVSVLRPFRSRVTCVALNNVNGC